MTVVPLRRILVACSAPTMTGLSRARPTIAAWELAPPFSVTMPDAERSSGRIRLEVDGITRMSPDLKDF